MVNTHGPLISQVTFSVISSDSSLESALVTGSVQAAEWQFLIGSYTSMASNANVKEGETAAYTFEGIAFNTVKPYMNNVNYRQAMAYLVSYSYIESTVLSSVEGTASINFLPCVQYPGACYSGKDQYFVPSQATDLLDAAKLLAKAGLVPGTSGGSVVTLSASTLSTIANWYAGPGFYNAKTNTAAPQTCTGTSPLASACIFSPLFYYRSDDPIRSGAATNVCSTAKQIGLQLDCVGIPSSSAGADVYGESIEALVTPASYVPSTGYNKPAVYNSTVVNGTSTVPSADTWDMYTFGWVLSPYYNWTWYMFNSLGADNMGLFINYYNPQIDYTSNQLFYASSNSAAAKDAKTLATELQVQLPYLPWLYENDLFASYVNGWTGYANEASTGPNTGIGLFYTLLNVHPTSSGMGGNLNLALHSIADQSGLNPLYETNWVWQADIYGQISDGPLYTPPTATTTVNAYLQGMTTGCKGSMTALYNCWVQPFSGSTPTGAGAFNAWQPGSKNVAQKIVNGEKITFTFRNNMTFTDNVPVTVYDYNYSLYAWDVTGLSGSVTPIYYEWYGPSGLISTYINPSSPTTITLYVNSSTIWNLSDADILVMPQHIFSNFNIADFSQASGAVDISQPSTSTATDAASSSFCGKGCLLNDPVWMQYLPNLDVGSGPFYLYTYAGVTSGAGIINANLNWDRANWQAIAALPANSVAKGSAFSFAETIQQFTYNPTKSTATFGGDSGSLASGATGMIGITNATGSIQLYNSKGVAVGSAIPLGTSTNGVYTVSIPTTKLGPGAYEIVVTATYNFLGLARTWYQADGFTVTK